MDSSGGPVVNNLPVNAGKVGLIPGWGTKMPYVCVRALLGSSVHGILQARILEWVAISYSRGSSPPLGAFSSVQLLSRVQLFATP